MADARGDLRGGAAADDAVRQEAKSAEAQGRKARAFCVPHRRAAGPRKDRAGQRPARSTSPSSASFFIVRQGRWPREQAHRPGRRSLDRAARRGAPGSGGDCRQSAGHPRKGISVLDREIAAQSQGRSGHQAADDHRRGRACAALQPWWRLRLEANTSTRVEGVTSPPGIWGSRPSSTPAAARSGWAAPGRWANAACGNGC